MPTSVLLKSSISAGFNSPPVLDSIPTANAAYSLRKLKKNFVGPCVRVRRSSDNAELDIPFCYDHASREYVICQLSLKTFVGTSNLLKYSEDFSQASIWILSATSVNADVTIAPDGRLTADDINFGTTSNLYQSITKDATPITYTSVIYLKGSATITFSLDDGAPTNRGRMNVDLSTGNISSSPTSDGDFTNTSGTVVASSNGFYKITLTTTSNSSTTLRMRFFMASQTTVSMWGAQLNTGTTANTYTKSGIGVAGNGYITKWYDQTSNSKDVIQSTAGNQPIIVNAGVIETLNNKPTIRFISANSTYLLLSTYTPLSGTFNYISAEASDITSMIISSTNMVAMHVSGLGCTVGVNLTNYRYTPDNNELNAYKIRTVDTTLGGENTIVYANGIKLVKALSQGSGSSTDFRIGARASATLPYNGYIAEIIIMENNVMNRPFLSKLETNQGKFYNVGLTI